MHRSTERILTTHVGSLVRPLPVLKIMRALSSGESVNPEQFDTTVKAAVADVVKKQVEAGVDIPSDGEFARQGFSQYIWHRVAGLEPREVRPDEDVWGGRPEAEMFP